MPEPVTLQELKDFARIDGTADDTLITSLGIAAREFVEQAAGIDVSSTEAPPVPEKAKIAIQALAGHWYEFREPVIVSTATNVPMHVKSLLYQLTDWSKLGCTDEATA